MPPYKGPSGLWYHNHNHHGGGGGGGGGGGRSKEGEIYVGNLDFACTHQDIADAFQHIGDIADIHFPTDRETGEPRGFAFVKFSDPSCCDRAVQEMDGHDMNGRQIRVNPSGQSSGGGGGGGYSGGGGGGRRNRGSSGGGQDDAAFQNFGRNNRSDSGGGGGGRSGGGASLACGAGGGAGGIGGE